ncbi:MAG TPA: DUF4149 domain-containing protein [Candidatus Binataceae bacterium]|nr:DUF4149 domain-containing protein [Candidatus Binataceae bacterium]
MIVLFLYLLALGCWLGAVVFFSFVTAPAVFINLPIAEAGKVIGAIFPRYYLVGYIAGAIAVVLAIYLTISASNRGWWSVTALGLAIALGLTFYAGLVILPRADSLRHVAEESNPDPAQKSEFDHLHSLSVYLNGAVLLLDLWAVLGTAGALSGRG